MNELDMNKNTPEKKFRASPITATVWTNEVKDKEGKISLYRTISLERSYKDKDGSWKKTTSLRSADLPKAALLLNKAYEFIVLKEEEDSIGEM